MIFLVHLPVDFWINDVLLSVSGNGAEHACQSCQISIVDIERLRLSGGIAGAKKVCGKLTDVCRARRCKECVRIRGYGSAGEVTVIPIEGQRVKQFVLNGWAADLASNALAPIRWLVRHLSETSGTVRRGDFSEFVHCSEYIVPVKQIHFAMQRVAAAFGNSVYYAASRAPVLGGIVGCVHLKLFDGNLRSRVARACPSALF